jgi:hypothetical protein
MSKITPIQVGRLILEPIRYFFANRNPDGEMWWDADPKKTKIDISMVNDATKELPDHGMQILVDRGAFRVSKTGISDNMMDGKPMSETKGLQDRRSLLFAQGSATVIIKARSEGTVEILTDMVFHILQWSRPHIADIQGFKDFGLPMDVSSPRPVKPDVECFEVQISVPYMIEDAWQSNNDALKLRDLFLSIANR